MPMTERFFNTTGPVVPAKHYCIPPLERFDLKGILKLIQDERYFVLHAPRQTGKTSGLLALRDLLNGSGEYRCVYTNVEVGQTARGDVGEGMRAILGELADRAITTLDDGYLDGVRGGLLETEGPHGALRRALGRWARNDPRPLVLFIDEIDSLVGDTLISVLRQLRAGYDERPAAFPQSVILCGVRDVRVANPVYAEVIPRELTLAAQEGLTHETAWYVQEDGGLDVEGLLAAFQRFFREHSEHAMGQVPYREAAAQLLLQAFLQRVVNGGGRIEREYALGRRRTDLLIVWPPGKFAGGSEAAAPPRRYVIECKILHRSLGATIREGARQTLDYMDRRGAESGHLVVFDRAPGKPWEEKIFRREESLDGRTVTVWGA